MMTSAAKLIASGALVTATLLSPFSVAAQDQTLTLDLNTVQTEDDSCRLTFVVGNGIGGDIDSLVVESVLFSKDGGVVMMTLFDMAEIPARAPRVRQFVVPSAPCEGLQSILINGVQECRMGELQSDLCQTGLSVNSRTEIEVLG